MARRSDFTGFFPSPYFATSEPQTMNPILVTASTVPHISTRTIESPYASIRAMNTPPRKLFHMAKNIIAKSQEIESITITTGHVLAFKQTTRIVVLFTGTASSKSIGHLPMETKVR